MISLHEAYLNIAHRYIESTEILIENESNIQEVIGFKTYHIFESLGGAFIAYVKQPIPIGHEKKINAFVANYKTKKIAKISPKVIAKLAITLNSLRNKMLYPEYIPPLPSIPIGLLEPEQQITLADAKQLFKQVKGITTAISEAITEDSSHKS